MEPFFGAYFLGPIFAKCRGTDCISPLALSVEGPRGTIAGEYTIANDVPGVVFTEFTPSDPLSLGESYTIVAGGGDDKTRLQITVASDLGLPVEAPSGLAGRSFAFSPRASRSAKLDNNFSSYWEFLTIWWGLDEPHLPVMTITGVSDDHLELTFWVKDDNPETSARDVVQDYCSPTLSLTATWEHDNTTRFSLPWFPGPGTLNVGDGSADFRVTFSPEGLPVWSDHIYGQDSRFFWNYDDWGLPWGRENPDFVDCASDGQPWCVREWIFQGLSFTEVEWTSPIEPIAQANCHPQCPESANNPDCAL